MPDVDYDPRHKPYRYPLDSGLAYVWHGGAYIDVVQMTTHGDVPTDVCLNVWDYQSDRATIDLTPRAFLAVVCEHAGEDPPGRITVWDHPNGYILSTE